MKLSIVTGFDFNKMEDWADAIKGKTVKICSNHHPSILAERADDILECAGREPVVVITYSEHFIKRICRRAVDPINEYQIDITTDVQIIFTDKDNEVHELNINEDGFIRDPNGSSNWPKGFMDTDMEDATTIQNRFYKKYKTHKKLNSMSPQ